MRQLVKKIQNFFMTDYSATSLAFLCFFIILVLLLPTETISGKFSSDQVNNVILNIEQIGNSDIFQFDTSIPGVNSSNVIIDGRVETDEYNESFFEPMKDFTVFWEHNEVNLTVALVYQGTGWVSLGIGDKMEGSNMIMGGFDGTSPYSVDLIGLTGWNHESDTENDGTNDILEAVATDDGSQTVFEFIMPLNSSDPLDTPMQVNKTYNMFFGYQSSSDSITAIHTGHSAIISVYLRPIGMKISETNISITAPKTINQGNELFFNVFLEGQQESTSPLANKSIYFFMETMFGDLIIEAAKTNSTGDAIFIYYHPDLIGNVTFGVKFSNLITIEENQWILYKRSEIRQSILIIPLEKPGIDPTKVILGLIGLGIASFSLITVWIFYLYNGFSLLRFLFDKKPSNQRLSEVSDKIELKE